MSAAQAGLRNARAKGKQLGGPRKGRNMKRMAELRAKGFGWKRIAAEMGIGIGTLYRVSVDGSKIREMDFLNSKALSNAAPSVLRFRICKLALRTSIPSLFGVVGRTVSILGTAVLGCTL